MPEIIQNIGFFFSQNLYHFKITIYKLVFFSGFYRFRLFSFFQILAINRAEKNSIVTVKLKIKDGPRKYFIHNLKCTYNGLFFELFLTCNIPDILFILHWWFCGQTGRRHCAEESLAQSAMSSSVLLKLTNHC